MKCPEQAKQISSCLGLGGVFKEKWEVTANENGVSFRVVKIILELPSDNGYKFIEYIKKH